MQAHLRFPSRHRRPAAIRWKLLVSLTLFASFIGGLAWLAWPRPWTATSYVEVLERRSVVFNDDPPVSEASFARAKRRWTALATSPLVLESALMSKAAPDGSHITSTEQLRQLLEVSYPDDGNVLQFVLTCTRETAENDRRLLDAIVRSFADNAIMQSRVADSTRQDALTTAFADMREKIKELQLAVDNPPAEVSHGELELLKLDLESAKEFAKALNKQILKAHLITRVEEMGAARGPGEGRGYPVRIVQPVLISK